MNVSVASIGTRACGSDGAAVQVAAAVAALTGAGLLAWTDRRWPDFQEALIGTLFALAATASVQLVGVYLVFASLIVPALATAGMTGARQLARRSGY